MKPWEKPIHLDDAEYITDNVMVQSGLSPAAIWQAIFGFHHTNWHPLIWISYMAEVQLFGLNLKVMHATNILLHAANSLFFFCWLAGITGNWQLATKCHSGQSLCRTSSACGIGRVADGTKGCTQYLFSVPDSAAVYAVR